MRRKMRAEERRTHVIQVAVNQRERQAWILAARSADRSLSGWLRVMVNAVVERSIGAVAKRSEA